MNNVTYMFENFSSILKSGKQDGCDLSNDAIKASFQRFQLLFILWDGAFLFARKIDSTTDNANLYQQFIDANLDRHVNLGLKITPKVHLTLKHVR